MEDLCLMMKDKLVMNINFDIGKYEIINESLLPFTLQGALRRVPDYYEIKSRYDDTQRQIAINKNRDAVTGWLANRVLPLSRDNAKKVYNLLRIEQVQDDYSKAKIAIMCRAVSLQDNYWIKIGSEKVTWNNVNLRTNKLNEIIAQVSLHGSSLSLQGKLITPELTGQGAYAKAWKREGDKLWLYKRGYKDPTEARIEVMVSDILDKCNVPHIHYELAESMSEEEGAVTCCRCECMTTEELNILPAMDYHTYCIRHNLDFYEECKRIDKEMYYKMCIIDYLIANSDRHGLNWGFYFNCDTNMIIGMHPLFDHNNAFDLSHIQNEDAMSLVMDNTTMKRAAIEGIFKVDFHFTAPITEKDFITKRQYDMFIHRCKQLDLCIPV